MDVHIDVFKPGDVQDRVDVVRGLLEDNLATMTAAFKGLADSGSIVCFVRSTAFHNARLSMAG